MIVPPGAGFAPNQRMAFNIPGIEVRRVGDGFLCVDQLEVWEHVGTPIISIRDRIEYMRLQ
jgi:hypothetical protein